MQERIKLTDYVPELLKACKGYMPANTVFVCRQMANGLTVWATDRHFIFMARYESVTAPIKAETDFSVSITGRDLWADEPLEASEYCFANVTRLFRDAAAAACDTPQAVSAGHMAVMFNWIRCIAQGHPFYSSTTYCKRLPFALLATGKVERAGNDVHLAFLCSLIGDKSWGKGSKECMQAVFDFDPPF